MGGLQLTIIEVELIAETLTFCGGEDGTIIASLKSTCNINCLTTHHPPVSSQ